MRLTNLVNKMKKFYILRGVPGCGKTTLAEELRDLYTEFDKIVVVCEANDYFMRNGEYNYSPSLLPKAHEECKKRVISSMESGADVIILTNTSTQFWEYEEYLNLADEFGYKTSVLVVENHHNGKSPHGVPEEKLNVMRRRFDLKL